MSNFLSSFNLSNEQVLLINTLSSMYNDNLIQINNYQDSIYSLNNSNNEIRIQLSQILNPLRENRRNIQRDRQNQRTNTIRESNNSNGLGRIYLNNRPYIIDNIQEYRIPSRINRNENLNTNFSNILQTFFQPVDVYPTPSQIEAATRCVRYCDIISPRNRACPISLDNFNDSDMVTVIRFCGHIFNTEELNTWFRSNCRCPVCRYDIRNYNSNASSEFFGPTGSSNNSMPTSSNNPINEGQNSFSQTNEERNNNSNILGTLLNRFVGEITPQEEEVLNFFVDLSGNYINDRITDTTSLMRLFSNRNYNYR